jgi:hypothetical protein
MVACSGPGGNCQRYVNTFPRGPALSVTLHHMSHGTGRVRCVFDAGCSSPGSSAHTCCAVGTIRPPGGQAGERPRPTKTIRPGWVPAVWLYVDPGLTRHDGSRVDTICTRFYDRPPGGSSDGVLLRGTSGEVCRPADGVQPLLWVCLRRSAVRIQRFHPCRCPGRPSHGTPGSHGMVPRSTALRPSPEC